ncbi:MAG: hypothetical protein LC745_05805, partial [Planctomycetia bacterium]|nr:hypothetical protein [Planctomycetia bacterium]
YHPAGDETNEVQVYIFELGDTLKALGKFGTEKPGEVTPVQVGAEGYTSAGSTLFYAGPFYTQIVSTKDDAKFSEFALSLAKRIAEAQKPGKAAAPAVASAPAVKGEGEPEGETPEGKPKPAPTAAANAPAPGTPEAFFALLPTGSGRANQTYVSNDVFGYSFLSDVFLADYSEGSASWKGFLRAFASPDEARAVFEKYLASARQDGAEIKELEAEGADRMVAVSNIGLFDAVFIKGNTLAGAAGSTEPKPTEAFARAFAKALPSKVAAIAAEK